MHLIAVVDENWGLGRRNGLLFRLPPDMRRFQSLTTGGVVIMGRRTLESFPGGRPLKDRLNLVLSRELAALPTPASEGAVICSCPAALADALASPIAADKGIWLIGGAAVYRALLPFAKDAYITHVYAGGNADCFLENLAAHPAWELTEIGPKQEYKGIFFAFARYENRETLPLTALRTRY